MTWAPFAKLSTDFALGAFGCGLATASATFGLYMVVVGPPPGSFGNSKDFTVFAQLAPRRHVEAAPAKPPPQGGDDLDFETTASIPRRSGRAGRPPDTQTGIVPFVALKSADAGEATIVMGGHAMVVRVGDIVPGAGEVLAITPGAQPEIVTTRGRIVTSPPR